MKAKIATIPRLLAAYRAAKRGESVSTGLDGFYGESTWKPSQFFAWFRRCLENKINSHDPRFPNGRKTSDEYETACIRLRAYIGNRIIIDWLDPVLGPRVHAAMEHRLRRNME